MWAERRLSRSHLSRQDNLRPLISSAQVFDTNHGSYMFVAAIFGLLCEETSQKVSAGPACADSERQEERLRWLHSTGLATAPMLTPTSLRDPCECNRGSSEALS